MRFDHDKHDRARRGATGSDTGFTLVEVSIILVVLSVLSMVLLPSISGYLRDARLARARADLSAIGKAIERFLADTGEVAFRCVGNGNRDTAHDHRYEPGSPDPYYTSEMLISDGDTPDGGNFDDAWKWRRSYDGHFVDTLANHLVQNSPGDNRDARYRTAEDLRTGIPSGQFAFASQQGFGARFAWRGPYVSAPVRSDPWGNRYAVNVLYLDPVSDSRTSDGAGYVYDVFVLSAGPDEAIDTPFEVDGAVAGDDDLILVLSGSSR